MLIATHYIKAQAVDSLAVRLFKVVAGVRQYYNWLTLAWDAANVSGDEPAAANRISLVRFALTSDPSYDYYSVEVTIPSGGPYQVEVVMVATHEMLLAGETPAAVGAYIALPVMQGSVYTATAAQKKTVEVSRGDTPRIIFDLGADYTGWTVWFGAKAALADTVYAIAVKQAVWTDSTKGQGYVDLTAAETATVSRLLAEIEIRNGAQTLTAMKFVLDIKDDVIK